MLSIKGISVVIPNYNGVHLFVDTFPVMFDILEKSNLPYEVIVSDDHSTDGSIEWLQKYYPRVTILRNEKNLGFSPTINKGIFAATLSHVLLLNSDVMLTPGYFDGLDRYFDRDDTFGVMSRIIGWHDDIIQDGGKYPSYHGLKIKTSGNYIPAPGEEHHWLYSMYLSGANALVDREKLLLLNGFNEMFAPYYVEDYELSLRAWRLGWKCYYDHDRICRHQESTTIKSNAKKKKVREIYYRNKMYLHALHLPAGQLFFWHIQFLFESLGNLVLLRTYYIRSAVQYCKNISVIRSKRKSYRRLAHRLGRPLLSVKQVTNFVSDEIGRIKIIFLK